MKVRHLSWPRLGAIAAALLLATLPGAGVSPAQAQAPAQKPNIMLIVADDLGYGDTGPYGGGEGRGMPTPSIDRLSNEGMTLFSFYAQPSCTPGGQPFRPAASPTAAA